MKRAFFRKVEGRGGEEEWRKEEVKRR